MKLELVSKRTHRKYKEYRKVYPTRRAAFRAAKRDRKIPCAQHPTEVIYPGSDMGDSLGLDGRNTRLYIFNMGVLAIVIYIREDKEAFYTNGDDSSNQPPHFNSGSSSDNKLKDHHYWKK